MVNPDKLLNFVEWDVRNWSVALDFWLANSTQNLKECKALEIGTNFGGLSLWLASKGARVVCSDIRVKEEAVRRHKAGGVSHLIEYQTIDATDIPYTEHFDVIVFKSVLGAPEIGGKAERQAKAVAEMHKALKKGGELFFAENLVGSPMHMFLRRKMIKWGADWRYITIDEMKDFLAPFSDVRLQMNGFAGTFGRNETQRNWLGRADKILFDPIVPDKWKYIISGVARK
jgi:SAM-dependent methyltransferase